MIKKIINKLNKIIINFIENNRHIFEVSMDVLHFYIIPLFFVLITYYSWWWWNADFIDHSNYVDLQFSLRGNTISVPKTLKHEDNIYWLYEIDWPNRLLDIYRLDKENKISKRRSNYIFRHTRLDLRCKQSEAWKLVNENLDAKGFPAKFRNFFYRKHCQNIDHNIYSMKKGNNKEILEESKKLNKFIKELNIKRTNASNNIKPDDLICGKKLNNSFFFINDNYLEYKKRENIYLDWKYKKRFAEEALKKSFIDNSFYTDSKSVFEEDADYKFFELYWRKLNDISKNDYLIINREKIWKDYRWAKNLKFYNNENFFSPFSLEIRYLEYKENKMNYDFFVENRHKKGKEVIKKILDANNYKRQFDWKQYFLADLNFENKKKLLLESRLRNRVYQELLFNWSNGKRVPYKFKSDSLMNNKIFNVRAYHFEDYKLINDLKKHEYSNRLSIATYANNYCTTVRHVYRWDTYNGLEGWFWRTAGKSRYSFRWVEYDNNVWNEDHYPWEINKESYFYTDYKSRRKKLIWRGFPQNYHYKRYACKTVYCNKWPFRKRNVRACMNIKEELYTLFAKEQNYKHKKFNESNKLKKILKTELTYNKGTNLCKKRYLLGKKIEKKNFITTFPLRQTLNVDYYPNRRRKFALGKEVKHIWRDI